VYYRLSSDLVKVNVYMKEMNNSDVILISGELLDPEYDPEEIPFKFEMSVRQDVEDGSYAKPTMNHYFGSSRLMHKSLVDVIQTAGVDNLEVFPAIVTWPEKDWVIDDYVVVNIVGLISCAVKDQSDTTPLADVDYFHSITIDPARTNNMLIFRLAESQIEVLVHEQVADAIKAGNFEGVVLEPIAEI
jgi:hypothetical protein